MSELYVFEDTQVTIIQDENGEPLFELYSSGMALGFVTNAKGKAYPHKTRINKCVKNAEIPTVVQGVQQFLTEPQLYDFMLEARTEKCKKFRKWVVTEVLPQIRQTGGYIPVEEGMSDAELMAKALMVAQKTLEQKDKIIEAQKPKVIGYDEYVSADGTYTSEKLGKKLGFSSAYAFNTFLKENKIIFKRGKEWIPYANIPSNTYKFIPYINNYTGVQKEYLRFTPAMVDFLREKGLI